jgi:hypothetical protein
MKAAIWGFFGLMAAMWSLLAWLLHGIAGAGSAAVVSLSKWMGIDPSQTQWIADGLAAAGWLAQAVVILIWLLGMGVLGLFGVMGSRAVSGMEEIGEELRRGADVRGGGPVVEGEVAVRRVDPARARDEGPARLG